MKKLLTIGMGILLLGACTGEQKFLSQEELLKFAKGHDLVAVFPDGRVETYNGRGLGPLLTHLETKDLKGAQMYDKVTGRASALLLAYGGAVSLHTGMLSKEAIEILEKYHIQYTADKEVEYILNRSKTGSCPMETIARNLNDVQEAFPILKAGYEALVSQNYTGQ